MLTATPKYPFVILTPLKNWTGEECTIKPGLRIRRLNDADMPDFDSWAHFLSGREIDELKRQSFWLCHDYEDSLTEDGSTGEAACEAVDRTLSAIQVLAPIGGENILLVSKISKAGWVLESGLHRQRLSETVWGRLSGLPVSFTSDLPIVLERIQDVFRRQIVRLQNPVLLLEHGLQATNLHIRILLWTTGLDALIMANKRSEFCERIFNLLGENTRIFPQDDILNRQPKYTVGDVADDLYELRSEIAHGREISRRFREKTGFLTENGHSVEGIFQDYQYRQVLHECAVFLLCQALRKIFLLNLADVVASERKWRERLQTPLPESGS
jgi:hypothetical protein